MKVGDNFPNEKDKLRLEGYREYTQLLKGEHYRAFKLQKEESQEYQKLRYTVANYTGLISKMCGDMIFGKPVQIKSKDNQDWLTDFWDRNFLHRLNYESAINNSAHGDAIFRIRVVDNEITVESIKPDMYFPEIENSLYQQDPKVENLVWIEVITDSVTKKDTQYAVYERHSFGAVDIQVFKLEQGKLTEEIAVDRYNALAQREYEQHVDTGLDDRNLLIHIPNYRLDYEYFGTSDFLDIRSLIEAMNNRLTKIDNILDKHSDPILALPPGILDEDGKVKKRVLNLIEMPEDGQGAKPEYIVWNANLEAAWKQLEKLQELVFLMSETAPDAFGIGQGAIPASGVALKMRLIRTVAKMNRKKLYYEAGLYELMETIQLLSKNKGYTVGGKKVDTVDDTDLIWSDGIIDDDTATLTHEVTAIESGLQSKKRAIQTIYNIDEVEADLILEEISDEKTANNPFWARSNTVLPSRGKAGVEGVNPQQTIIPIPAQTQPVQVPPNGQNPTNSK